MAQDGAGEQGAEARAVPPCAACGGAGCGEAAQRCFLASLNAAFTEDGTVILRNSFFPVK